MFQLDFQAVLEFHHLTARALLGLYCTLVHYECLPLLHRRLRATLTPTPPRGLGALQLSLVKHAMHQLWHQTG